MDLILLITGIVQVALSLLIAIFLIFTASKIFRNMISGINETEELKKNNVAVAILNGSIVLALILVVKKSIESAITIFANTLRNPDAVISSYFAVCVNNARTHPAWWNNWIHIHLCCSSNFHLADKRSG